VQAELNGGKSKKTCRQKRETREALSVDVAGGNGKEGRQEKAGKASRGKKGTGNLAGGEGYRKHQMQLLKKGNRERGSRKTLRRKTHKVAMKRVD